MSLWTKVGCQVVFKVLVTKTLTCCHLLSGQSLRESPWGQQTWRSLLARASCYPARLLVIQLWMSLSRGHLTASSLTSNETAINLRKWAGWVSSSIKLCYLLGLIEAYCVLCVRKGTFHCPAFRLFRLAVTPKQTRRHRLGSVTFFNSCPVKASLYNERHSLVNNWDFYLLNWLSESLCRSISHSCHT